MPDPWAQSLIFIVVKFGKIDHVFNFAIIENFFNFWFFYLNFRLLGSQKFKLFGAWRRNLWLSLEKALIGSRWISKKHFFDPGGFIKGGDYCKNFAFFFNLVKSGHPNLRPWFARLPGLQCDSELEVADRILSLGWLDSRSGFQFRCVLQ